MSKMYKRGAPAEVEPVMVNGLRIEAAHDGYFAEVEQRGGYIVAYDHATGERLWQLLVYETKYIEGKETDVQDILIYQMRMSKKGLKIVNELEQTYLVNLEEKTVLHLVFESAELRDFHVRCNPVCNPLQRLQRFYRSHSHRPQRGKQAHTSEQVHQVPDQYQGLFQTNALHFRLLTKLARSDQVIDND